MWETWLLPSDGVFGFDGVFIRLIRDLADVCYIHSYGESLSHSHYFAAFLA